MELTADSNNVWSQAELSFKCPSYNKNNFNKLVHFNKSHVFDKKKKLSLVKIKKNFSFFYLNQIGLLSSDTNLNTANLSAIQFIVKNYIYKSIAYLKTMNTYYT